jgi:tripartite-type tricarboxylate transporter receptor subunit TctC
MGLLLVAMLFLTLGTSSTMAQAYPDRPVRLVIPFAAGGALDVIGRPIAEQFQRLTGQPMVLENRAGAAGTIAADYVAKARPDGYTLFMATSGPVTVAPSLFATLPYDPQRDLLTVTYLVNMPNALFAAPSAGNDLSTILAAARAAPGGISFGYPGTASQGHLALALMSQATGTEFLAVSYRGASLVLNDMVAGTVSLTFTTYATARGLLADGRVRPIAVAAATRTASMPDVPTFAELGFPRVEVPLWAGIMAPRGTPDIVIARLHETLRAAVTSDPIRQIMQGVGADIAAQGPGEFAAMLRADHARWAEVIRLADIKP